MNLSKLEERKEVEVKEVKIGNLYELQRLLNQFRNDKSEQVSAELNGFNSDTPCKFKVTTLESTDYKAMLIKGFKSITKRQELIEKHGDGASKVFRIDSLYWLDQLISRRMGGKREGSRIRWDLPDAIYYYDPLSDKLSRSING